MSLISNLIISFAANIVSLWAIANYVPGFEVSSDAKSMAIAAGVLAVLYVFIRPIIKFVMTPITIITLGLGLIAVNMIILKILTFAAPHITIDGLIPLFWGAIILGLVNFVIGAASKSKE